MVGWLLPQVVWFGQCTEILRPGSFILGWSQQHVRSPALGFFMARTTIQARFAYQHFQAAFVGTIGFITFLESLVEGGQLLKIPHRSIYNDYGGVIRESYG